jgi:hypothetical protein
MARTKSLTTEITENTELSEGVGAQGVGERHDANSRSAGAGDLTGAQGGFDGRNITNEANLNEDVKMIEIDYTVEVMADSGVGSGLDNLRTKPKSEGGGNDDDGAVTLPGPEGRGRRILGRGQWVGSFVDCGRGIGGDGGGLG